MGDCSRKKNAQGVEKALAMYERGYAILEKRLGPDSVELVEPMEKMAGVLVKAFSGEFANAEKLLRRCVQLIEQHRGPDDASMAAACVDLGAVLRKIGSCDEAVAVEERAVAVLLKTAPDKPDAGVLQGAVALAVWKLGDLPKATTTMEAACAELAKFPDMSEKPPTNHYIVMLHLRVAVLGLPELFVAALLAAPRRRALRQVLVVPAHGPERGRQRVDLGLQLRVGPFELGGFGRVERELFFHARQLADAPPRDLVELLLRVLEGDLARLGRGLGGLAREHLPVRLAGPEEAPLGRAALLLDELAPRVDGDEVGREAAPLRGEGLQGLSLAVAALDLAVVGVDFLGVRGPRGGLLLREAPPRLAALRLGGVDGRLELGDAVEVLLEALVDEGVDLGLGVAPADDLGLRVVLARLVAPDRRLRVDHLLVHEGPPQQHGRRHARLPLHRVLGRRLAGGAHSAAGAAITS